VNLVSGPESKEKEKDLLVFWLFFDAKPSYYATLVKFFLSEYKAW
jgi:hypothetical protein